MKPVRIYYIIFFKFKIHTCSRLCSIESGQWFQIIDNHWQKCSNGYANATRYRQQWHKIWIQAAGHSNFCAHWRSGQKPPHGYKAEWGVWFGHWPDGRRSERWFLKALENISLFHLHMVFDNILIVSLKMWILKILVKTHYKKKFLTRN